MLLPQVYYYFRYVITPGKLLLTGKLLLQVSLPVILKGDTGLKKSQAIGRQETNYLLL